MNKQTAVEYLIEQLQAPCRGIPSHIIEQANKMFEQQIIEAAERWKGTDFAEKYYNETYGSKGSDDSPKVENKDSFGEISDEEIENCVGDGMHDFYKGGFIEGAKWYREQLKQRQ